MNITEKAHINDEETWKFLRQQMKFNFFFSTFLGVFFLGIFVIGYYINPWLANIDMYELECIIGHTHKLEVWEPKDFFADIYITMMPIILIFGSTMHYVVFFTIPYKHDKIAKTEKEIQK